MKFRKKPIVIEAEQWCPGKNIDGVIHELEFVLGCPCNKYYIETLEGKMEVKTGDWIITGVKGEKYPCKPDIFDMTYEREE